MDEQKPEEMEGQIPATDLSQPVTEEETDIILNINTKDFLKKLGY
jgi:hypothetical protein